MCLRTARTLCGEKCLLLSQRWKVVGLRGAELSSQSHFLIRWLWLVWSWQSCALRTPCCTMPCFLKNVCLPQTPPFPHALREDSPGDRPCDRQALLTHGRCQRFFQWGKLKPNHTSGTCTGLVAKEASFPLAILSNPGFTCICEFFYYYLCWQLKTWLQMWMKLITKTVAKNTPYFKPVLQMSMIFKMFSPCPAR